MSIDISTHQLAEQTCKALGGKVSLEEILTIWHAIGNVIKNQLTYKKGVKMSSFGTFTLTDKGEPIFLISSDLTSQFKLKQRPQPASGNFSTSSLNFSLVREGIELPRETVEKVYTKFLTCMGRAIFEARNILITIHRVAEISISNGELVCNFIPKFLSLFQAGGDPMKTGKQRADIRAEAKREQLMHTKYEVVERAGMDQFGREEPTARRGKQPARSGSNVRGGEFNPITGDAADRRRPASAGRVGMGAARRGSQYEEDNYEARRPSSARSASSRQTISTSSLLHSPRAQADARAGFRGGAATMTAGSRGGLRKEQLERFNKTQGDARGGNPVVDARKLAAKALDAGDIVEKVRRKIVERGGSNGIHSISKLLSIMDDNGDKRLSKDELRYGLRDYGIDLTPTELEHVFLYFDRDGNGFIDCTEFLVGLRGDLPPSRKKFVRMAFDILDIDKSGVVTTEEVMARYDFSWHPEVRAGKKTLKEAAREFMGQWDRKESDGLITPEEFEDYYKDVSAGIDDDSYFELMMRNAWRIAGGTGAAANTANKRVLVTNRDGTQSVQTIHNELGMKPGDKEEARRRLAMQGVDAADIGMHAGVDNRSKAARNPGGNPLLQSTGAARNRGGDSGNNIFNTQPTTTRHASAPRPSNRAPARAAVREAWADGPTGGDESYGPPEDERQPSPRRAAVRQANPASPRAVRGASGSGAVGSQRSAGFDTFATLQRLLYSPPTNMEPLCAKLQVSAASSSPRVAMGAFLKRMEALDPSLERHQLKALWQTVDPNNAGVVEVSTILDLLSGRYGVDKVTQKSAGVIERVIKKILERCGETAGIKGLQRTLAIMDNNGDKRLTKDELKYGLQDYGIELNIREMDEIFNYFDRDRNGVLDVNEFLIGIKGDLSERRKKFVKMAFNLLDTDRSGFVTVEEMMAIYDFSQHPEVKTGKKTVKEAMREFMGQWDDTDGDGSVSYKEFEDYYKGVSASIDGDDYFELMMRNAWRIAGGTGAAANTANKRVLVTNRDGTQSVQTIHNELGMKPGDKEEARRRLAMQGVDAADIGMHAGVDNRDKRGKTQMPMRNAEGGGRDRMNATAPNPRSEFTRHAAAAKLAAAYRGRRGRLEANYERKKQDAEERARLEEEEEQNRPRARQITRPKEIVWANKHRAMSANKQVPVPASVNFATAGMGGLFGWAVVHPFNTLGIRMNLATASGNAKVSFLPYLVSTVKTQGFMSLYSGLGAGMLRQVFYSTSRYGFFEVFRDELAKHRPTDFLSRLLAGVTSGALAAFISCPAEVTLVRISNDATLPADKKRNYKGVADAFVRILREEGVKTFFSGVGPFVNRAMMVGAVQVGTYDQFREMFKGMGVKNELLNVFYASMTSGLIYAVATMPMETAKNRMAFQKPDPVTKVLPYRSAVQTITTIAKTEGVLTLWSGFPPYYIRCGGHTVLMFMSVAWLRKQYQKMQEK